MASSAIERQAKAWDSLHARRFALDRFFTDIAERCRKHPIVSVSFDGFQLQTSCDQCPDGVPLIDARAEMSGMGRKALSESYGLYWRAVTGVGIQFTAERELGIAWYKELAFRFVIRKGQIVAELCTAAAIGATDKQKKSLGKLATMGEQLTAIASKHLDDAQKLLPPVEPADVSDIDEENDD